jgi:hypothetical protein
LTDSGICCPAIAGLDWKWKKYPVIRIDLNLGDYERGIEELSVTIRRMLGLCAEKYDVPFYRRDLKRPFARLIHRLYAKCQEKVVVIIDEYDKPLLTTINAPEIHLSPLR